MASPESLRSLLQVVREDLQAHRGQWSCPGFHAVVALRYNQWVHSLQPSLRRKLLVGMGRIAQTFCQNIENVELPYSVQLGRRVVFEHQGIVIHGDALIGDDCIIRQGCTLGNRYPERPHEAPILGHRVSLGAGAKILGKVVVGDDVNVGANSVVLKDVRAGSTVVGIPARDRARRNVLAMPKRT